MMLCPVDQTQLEISNRQGIEIDYCPRCRGVWLDRGELDKIIERDSQFSRPSRDYDERRHDSDDRRQDDRHYEQRRDYNDDHRGNHHDKKHKKEGLLGDLFDFG